jgi:BirA family biotin operon repressor/biotin-[acetyl-CoA-carboxylase] ligase
VDAWTGREATIKWPNDVRVGGRKIAGILVERAPAPGRSAAARPRALDPAPRCGVVIGIGLNGNMAQVDFPPDLAARATSLQLERAGAPVDRSELARDLIRRLDHWYETSCCQGAHTLNPLWCSRSEHMGRVVRVATPSATLTGRLTGLDVRLGLTLNVQEAAEERPAAGDTAPLVHLPLADVLALEPAADDHDRARDALAGRRENGCTPARGNLVEPADSP